MTVSRPSQRGATSTAPVLVTTLVRALERVADEALIEAGAIGWSSPVPAFGNPSTSRIATVGINPSNREFVNPRGKELVGPDRRFHTLTSLAISRWEDTDARHLDLMLDTASTYFLRNPYDVWFRPLDQVLSGVGLSFYGRNPTACHLDLIPFATINKWSLLSTLQRTRLLDASSDILGSLVRESPIDTLILNGRTVVSYFEQLAGITLKRRTIPAWGLPRTASARVAGIAFTGVVTSIADVALDRDLLVLGFNHNLQSSFGVTTQVMHSIRNWLARAISAA